LLQQDKANILEVNADGLMLTAYDPKGKEIFTWTWSLQDPEAIVKKISPVKGGLSVMITEIKLQNRESDFTVYIGKHNVFLEMLKSDKPKNAPNDYTYPPFPTEISVL
jgi:hypothetical protein